jgi:hypothetical protein
VGQLLLWFPEHRKAITCHVVLSNDLTSQEHELIPFRFDMFGIVFYACCKIIQSVSIDEGLEI